MANAAELTKHTTWNAVQWYDFACIYSLASPAITDKKKEYADRAMELLQMAVKEGWNDAKHAAQDTDLAPIRDREAFKKLLADLQKNAATQPEKKDRERKEPMPCIVALTRRLALPPADPFRPGANVSG